VIANRTQIGAQAGISKSIKEEGVQIIGYPAFDIKDYFRSYAVFKRLPELNDRLRALEKLIPSADPVDSVEKPTS
jgi:UDP-3-O-[3-hydroxymyristoyl] glucosamine N-acyltransferase